MCARNRRSVPVVGSLVAAFLTRKSFPVVRGKEEIKTENWRRSRRRFALICGVCVPCWRPLLKAEEAPTGGRDKPLALSHTGRRHYARQLVASSRVRRLIGQPMTPEGLSQVPGL